MFLVCDDIIYFDNLNIKSFSTIPCYSSHYLSKAIVHVLMREINEEENAWESDGRAFHECIVISSNLSHFTAQM